ncbi:hypothetical protein F8M41_009540 [Gigaspora margarita]|uniref:Uncharacterized protein n=2 Tax=Gigaspora margarita TaxID=4874 RepID=A0A8H4A3X0_GIGMA|nr:hypothetical protein F8M41_009540 [Gigaspora margarita]
MVFASSLEKRQTIDANCRINVTYPIQNQYIKYNETSYVIWNTTTCGDLTAKTVVQIIIYGWINETVPPWPILHSDNAYYGTGFIEFTPEQSWPNETFYIAMIFPLNTVGLSGDFKIGP